MRSHRLFSKTHWRLTLLCAGVIGVVVFLTQLAMHSSLWVVQTQGFDYSIEQLAGTIHDYLVAQLEQPGVVQAETRNVLTGADVNHINLLGIVRQQEYYIRLVDLRGRIIATSNFQPEGLSTTALTERWRTLAATDGTYYRQISEHLHTRDGEIWGYLQLGRSTRELKEHQRHLNLILAISVPVSMLVVGGVGYWLAGLAMRPIYRSYQQMEQFTSDAAHELRTPLTTTRTLVQTTLSKLRAGKWIDVEPLEAIERQNDRLTRLVADLLWLARADRTKQALRFQPCCLNDLIADLSEELAPMAQSADVDLTVRFASPAPVYVLGNEEQLYRLLSNLMVNGIQYTPAGGKVTVYLKQTHASAIVDVEDTGIGIAPQDQKKIFDRFYRADVSRSRHTGGTGLGLSIGMAIAQLHGGMIQVKSQLGQGSTFTVALPKSASFQSE
jgi:signal transduction histidine kinase